MARIHIDNDDSLPDLTELLKAIKQSPRKTTQSKPRKPVERSASELQQLTTSEYPRPTPRRIELENDKGTKPRQRALKKVENNARLASASKEKIKLPIGEGNVEQKALPGRIPRRIARSKVQELGLSDDDDVENEANSKKETGRKYEYDSDDSLPSPSKLFSKPRLYAPVLDKSSQALKAPSLELGKFIIPSVAAPKEKLPVQKTPSVIPSTSRPTSSSDNDKSAFLIYAPPKRYSPHKRAPQSSRPSTPPPSAIKQNILKSPSKIKPAKIPSAPLCPDIDAFWSQDVVNDWNEQWSPKKVLASPRKNRFVTPESDINSDVDAPSPSTSPRKSPVKRDKSAVQAKKDFETRRHQLAEEFLQELDEKVTSGQIAELAASGGGVKIIWNKKLNSTAGRANWRRECIKTTHSDGTVDRKYRHIANIELAEKVIDDEDRLINVLAHEFCHLANFMVSGVKDNPHGKEFKEWAKKCSHHFSHRNVKVTTKHSYDISYKYIWECTTCAHEYKRHSKSIDPTKHTCGSCKSKLVQTKPIPRAAGGKVSEYQTFVKENFARVKREKEGRSHGEVMEVLGREYRESRAADGKKELNLESIVKEMEIITLDD